MFKKFIICYLGAMLYFLFCIVIFFLAFYLYDLPLTAVLYPALICGVAGIVLIVFGVYHRKQKHDKLRQCERFTDEMIDHLPPIRSQDDTDYQAIIRRLAQERQQERNDAEIRYNDMVEYYSLWAHQIKTPIASMGLQLQQADSAEARSLRRDLNRIEQYADMVLTFLRLDADSTDYVFKPCAVDTIIKNAIRKFSGDFIYKHLTLTYVETAVMMITDEKWLSFVIEQVLSNAVKYTQKGGITIEADQNQIRISDTGIGIAPEDLPRIFEKGYTGYNGRLDRKASGIGLYLCKRVCDNLGMTISAESEISKGTTITIEHE